MSRGSRGNEEQLKNDRDRYIIGEMMRKIAAILLAAGIPAAAMAAAACGASPTTPANSATYSQTDLRLGTGTIAESGHVLSVNYTGWYYSAASVDRKGPEFDSNAGRDPFTFTLGGSEVIAGWDRGVAGMRVGGIRRLVVPPSLAYGSVRFGPIPPNATLLFEIELLDVQ
jgi:FKBP-type peptidyl-prolyl cis-trans isomerase FkpA